MKNVKKSLLNIFLLLTTAFLLFAPDNVVAADKTLPAWSSAEDTAKFSKGVSDEDFRVLVDIFKLTNGQNWINNTGWNVEENDVATWDPETGTGWYGIEVRDNRVYSIVLQNNNLSGELPQEIGSLTELRFLFVGNNRLAGPLPQSTENMTKLVQFFAENNSLTGSIPEKIGNLTALNYINLSNNNISGVIPDSIGNLSNLGALYLDNNQLEGAVPATVANLSNLIRFHLNNNSLSDLPDLSAAFPILAAFSVGSNNLTFDDLEPNMVHFQNDFDYSPQNSFGSNQIIGVEYGTPLSITVDVGGSRNLYRWSLNGEYITEWSPNPSYKDDSVSDYDFGVYVCEVTNTLVPDLVLTGLPITVVDKTVGVSSQEFAALRKIYESTGGDNWTRRDNWDFSSNNVSSWDPATGTGWYGIYLRDHHIIGIDLRDNNLTGGLPQEIGDLSFLWWLYLGNNNLRGALPAAIGRLSSLRQLVLNNNSLSEKIPDQIGSLSELNELNLSNNNFSGPIPSSIGNLSNLKRLHMGFNRLNGTLPQTLQAIPGLFVLSVCDNNISDLPNFEGGFENLIALCLGGNNLTFEDMEPNVDFLTNPGLHESYYSWQREYGVPSSLYLREGDTLKLNCMTGGTRNHYRWYLNGNEVNKTPPSTYPAYIYYVPYVSIEDAGSYRCVVSNELVPDMTLTSSTFDVSVIEGPTKLTK